MHTLRLLYAFFKVNLQMTLAYRVDTLVNLLLEIFTLAWELLSLFIIFSNTSLLGGWNLGELLALLGVFHLVNALMNILIWPNTEAFNTAVRDGTLDYTLLKPADSMFLVTFSRMVIWRVWDLALGAVLIIIGVHNSGLTTTLPQLISFLLLTVTGSLILYSLWIVLIAATFWFTKFDNNVTILQALLDTGRYPSSIYPYWLRLLITYFIPIAVATTIPVQALRGELTAVQVLLFLGISAASFFIASRIWQAGIKKYSGASS
ncbi:MAG TPA: ABC-2 family transporter protein [Anaerolineaceae bacterium]|nr:ABC-2 family transporter protein [Anaerolineaceae bacterium]